MTDVEYNTSDLPPLMALAVELTGISLLDKGTVNPYFLIASEKDAYQIEVDFSNQQQKEFTTVKIAAFLQHLNCDRYVFVTRIQFPAKAGDKEVMKQQVLILHANKTGDSYDCFANLFDMKINEQLGMPQLKFSQQLDDFDGQFSNLFEAPPIPADLMDTLVKDLESHKYKPN